MDGWTLCADERDRKPRNGVNVTGLCNDDSESWTRVVRDGQVAIISTGPLNADSRVHHGTDGSARFTDQRFRRAVAKRFSHGREANVGRRRIRLFRVHTEFSERGGEARARDTLCIKFNLSTLIYMVYLRSIYVSLINDRDLFAMKILISKCRGYNRF